MGKLIRLKNLLDTRPELNQMRRYPFLLVDGLIGDLTPWMGVGGHGTTSGIPNFAPAASARLYRLLKQDSLSEEEASEARRIQAILSNADADAVPGGIRAMSESYSIVKTDGLMSRTCPQSTAWLQCLATPTSFAIDAVRR